MHSLYSWLFSMPSNNDMVDIEKPGRICSLTFDEDDFSRFFYIHQSLLTIQDLHK